MGEREGFNKRLLMSFQILTDLNIFFKEIISVKLNANNTLNTS